MCEDNGGKQMACLKWIILDFIQFHDRTNYKGVGRV